MKRILITGKNSYVGNAFNKWLEQYPGQYQVDKISVRDNSWRDLDFSFYDVILHVAGIAHVSKNRKMEERYYRINRDLTIEIAKKAKKDGVQQFIFISSIIVYGDGRRNEGIISKDTTPSPSNFYGESKLEAEKGLKLLEDSNFKIVIIRPPMIYGRDSKGNFPRLVKLAKISPLFPNINNKRSMLYIDNLSEFIRLIINNEEKGIFFPQNKEYVKTSELVALIKKNHGGKVKLVRWFNWIVNPLIMRNTLLNKLFSDLVYDKALSQYKTDYQLFDLNESLERMNLDKKVDIIIMSDNSLESVGGEQESTKIIINGIKDSFNICVLQPGKIVNQSNNVDYPHLTNEIRIKHLIKKPISFMRYIIKIKRLVDAKQPTVIHTQAQVSFFIISLLRKCRLLSRNIKLIHTERGLYTKYNKFYKSLFIYFMKELDTLVTTTNLNMEYWKEAIIRKKMDINFKVIENTAGELFETYREENKKDNSEIIIGFAGRYVDWKNWPLAEDIAKQINLMEGYTIKVKMAVGCLDNKSLQATKDMFHRLYKLLGDRFEGKINISLEEMEQFYYDLDFFILTSNYNTESFGRTLVEAMSRNTVVLTTPSGGSEEVVDDDRNVCETVTDFVNRIKYFINNSNKMEEEKIKNLNRVREVYSVTNNRDKHIQLYNSIIHKKWSV